MLEQWTKSITEAAVETTITFIKYIPTVISSILLLLLGWFFAKLLSSFIYQVTLRIIKRFSKKVEEDSTTKPYTNVPRIVRTIVFWITFLFFLSASIATLGIPAISNVIVWFVQYLPKLLMALFIIFVGIWSSELIYSFLRSNITDITGIENAAIFSQFAKWMVILITFIIAIGQAGIESTLLITIAGTGFGAAFGALALAFGLGAKGAIRNVVNSYYIRKHYEVGDNVKIDEVEGKIIEIANSFVVVRTDSGNALIPAYKFSENISFSS